MYHQRVTDLHIVKEFVLIRSMMSQGNTLAGALANFDPNCCNFIEQYYLVYFPKMTFTCLFSYNSIYAYGQSKLANILHAKELSRILKVLFSKVIGHDNKSQLYLVIIYFLEVQQHPKYSSSINSFSETSGMSLFLISHRYKTVDDYFF